MQISILGILHPNKRNIKARSVYIKRIPARDKKIFLVKHSSVKELPQNFESAPVVKKKNA